MSTSSTLNARRLLDKRRITNAAEGNKTTVGLGGSDGLGGMQMKQSTPQVSYMVGVNGQQAGPFDWNQLQQLVQQGQLTQQTYVWKQGMANWAFAGQVQELLPLFANAAPLMPGMPPMPGM